MQQNEGFQESWVEDFSFQAKGFIGSLFVVMLMVLCVDAAGCLFASGFEAGSRALTLAFQSRAAIGLV